MKDHKRKELEEKLEQFVNENNTVMVEKIINEIKRLDESYSLDEVIVPDAPNYDSLNE